MKKKILVVLGIFTLALVSYTATVRTEYERGVCLNEQGDGKLHNGEPYYNYISYASTNAHTGDEVFTVLVLNPFNTYCDDYIYRHDWILGKE